VSVFTFTIPSYTTHAFGISDNPENITGNHFLKVLSVMSPQSSECLQVIQNETLPKRISTVGILKRHKNQIWWVERIIQHMYMVF